MLPTDAVPDWAPAWSLEEHRLFEAALGSALANRLAGFTLNAAGIVSISAEGDRAHAFSSHAIAACCAASGRPESFPAVIDQQLDLLLIGLADNQLAAELDRDWSRASAHLKIRLYPLAQVADDLAQLTHRAAGEGLVAVLVYDLPDSLLSVAPEVAGAWPVHGDALWRQAMANVMNDTPRLFTEPFPDSGGDAVLVSGDDCLLPTRLLFIETLLPDGYAPHGLIVAIPHRRALLFQAVGDLPSVRRALRALTAGTHRMFHAAGDPVSPSLYWWQPGSLQEIPFTIDAARGTLDVSLPEDLISLVEAASSEQPQGGG